MAQHFTPGRVCTKLYRIYAIAVAVPASSIRPKSKREETCLKRKQKRFPGNVCVSRIPLDHTLLATKRNQTL
jgi:hypothetical protein